MSILSEAQTWPLLLGSNFLCIYHKVLGYKLPVVWRHAGCSAHFTAIAIEVSASVKLLLNNNIQFSMLIESCTNSSCEKTFSLFWGFEVVLFFAWVFFVCLLFAFLCIPRVGEKSDLKDRTKHICLKPLYLSCHPCASYCVGVWLFKQYFFYSLKTSVSFSLIDAVFPQYFQDPIICLFYATCVF